MKKLFWFVLPGIGAVMIGLTVFIVSCHNPTQMLDSSAVTGIEGGALKSVTDEPPLDTGTLDISDGAHGGNEYFFFLPPLVSAPTVSGTFDSTMAPTVEIVYLPNGTYSSGASVIKTFTMDSGNGSDFIRVVAEDEHYIVNWDTDGLNPPEGAEYRIRVLLEPVGEDKVELGYADVMLADNMKEAKNLASGAVITLVNGRTLPIKFRIEQKIHSSWSIMVWGTDVWG